MTRATIEVDHFFLRFLDLGAQDLHIPKTDLLTKIKLL